MSHSVSQAFTDLEAFNSFSHGWDAHFRPVHSQDGQTWLHHTASENLLVNSGEFPGQTLQEGVTPRGMRTFALPTPGGPELLWMNREVSDTQFMIFNSEGDLRAITRPETSICTISVSNAYIEQFMDREGLGDDFLPRESLTLTTGQTFNRVLLELQSRLSRCIKSHAGQSRATTAIALEESHLLDTMLGQLIDMRAPDDRIKRHKSAEIAFRALDYIESHKRQLIRVSQICDGLGIGQRTLEQYFKKHLGVAPKQLVNKLRLWGFHQELLEADPLHANVSAVAANWGYWHMSQLARDYHAMHGELPSETLQHQ